MKHFSFLTVLLFAFALVNAQQVDIPLTNGDVEDTAPMYQNPDNANKWTISGMHFVENTDPSKFDVANSGLAPGEGVDGSQAIKSTIIDATGATANVQLNLDDVDISLNGLGEYTFSFYVKSSEVVPNRPFWINVNALNEDKGNVNSATLTVADNGGTVNFAGMESGYLQQTITVSLRANDAGGKDAQYLRLAIQHGKHNNTFFFDNFTLTGPERSTTFIEGEKMESQFSVYPNPASDYIVVSNSGGIRDISICSVNGSEVFYKKVDAIEFKVDLTAYPKGLYLIKTNGGEQVSKFIKR